REGVTLAPSAAVTRCVEGMFVHQLIVGSTGARRRPPRRDWTGRAGPSTMERSAPRVRGRATAPGTAAMTTEPVTCPYCNALVTVAPGTAGGQRVPCRRCRES